LARRRGRGRRGRAYPNDIDADGFLSTPNRAADDYVDRVPVGLADVAARAAHAQRIQFGGVDVLEDASGRLYLLEVNYPCYFAPAQLVAGIDIAGRMVFVSLRTRDAVTALSAHVRVR
jgi:hypothetical protein